MNYSHKLVVNWCFWELKSLAPMVSTITLDDDENLSNFNINIMVLVPLSLPSCYQKLEFYIQILRILYPNLIDVSQKTA